MKTFLLVVIAAVLSSAPVSADSLSITRDRAKNLSNQNANRGMEPSASTQARPAPTAPQEQPQRPAVPTDPVQRLELALGAIKTNSTVTAALKQEISRDLMNMAKSAKPAQAAVNKLTDDLVASLNIRIVGKTELVRVIQDIAATLNSAGLQPAQTTGIIDDAQKLLGAGNAHALAVAGDLREIALTLRKPAAK